MAKQARIKKDYSFNAFPHLLKYKPKERYVFHSDYFEVDNGVASILSYFHTEGAIDGFVPFWGINRIPSGLPDGVSVVVLEQTHRMPDKWLDDHQQRSEDIADMNDNEQTRHGNNTGRGTASRRKQDLEEIARELQNGASYLNVHYRLLVKAPNVEVLDSAIHNIERSYIDRFKTLTASQYIGEQRSELTNLFRKNEHKKGKGFYYTSKEYAGSYSLVTHGIEDNKGVYVGSMIGDVNNSAVLFDVNGYKHHVVIANDNYNVKLGRVHVSDMWASKISQMCLLDDHKVVHINLSGANMNKLGPRFTNINCDIDLNKGDVNMFEMFGSIDDELSIFASQMQKLILMAEQAYDTNDNDRAIIRGSLQDIATKFYIENRMWYDNAIANRDRLRVVGIPHKDVPKLEMFVAYLETEYKQAIVSSARDEERIHALDVLLMTFKNMLSANGDLFNIATNAIIDDSIKCRRVVYDFSKLLQRGIGVAMAQLVNVIGFAINNLGLGDSIIIHGAELLDDTIKDYLNVQFNKLYELGGRVVYVYNDIDTMLSDKEFCQFDKADYVILGNMTDTMVNTYQALLGQSIPRDLVKLVTNKGDDICYLRRGYDNVVFKQNLILHERGES